MADRAAQKTKRRVFDGGAKFSVGALMVHLRAGWRGEDLRRRAGE